VRDLDAQVNPIAHADVNNRDGNFFADTGNGQCASSDADAQYRTVWGRIWGLTGERMIESPKSMRTKAGFALESSESEKPV
jgi:hypothetical protein